MGKSYGDFSDFVAYKLDIRMLKSYAKFADASRPVLS